MEKNEFAQHLQNRTKKVAVELISSYSNWRKTDEMRIIGRQLLRSASSMAANYRAVCRARSKAEFFSKMSIVVEETDETLFWLEVLEETNLIPAQQLQALKTETLSLLSIFAKARKNT